MPSLDDIKTVIVVMMENRSFDQMLGYLSLPPFNRSDVDGQRSDQAWLDRFTNSDAFGSSPPFHHANPYFLPDDFDPPHSREAITTHLGALQNGEYPMTGFMRGLPDKINRPEDRKLVMGYFGAAETPVTHFFASHFTICDRWFCCLPAGTQPNRLMAMSGNSRLENNTVPLPAQDLVYDWLSARDVRWRVYHQGIPFFTMMLKWVPGILGGDHFRPFGDLESDLVNMMRTPEKDRPQVIFVEPAYGDAPHIGRSTDDHAPAGVSDGQEFLMQVYNAVSNSPAFWKQCALIVTYDEHGGFFDHVSPPLTVKTAPPPNAVYPRFESLGVRVPAFIISPFSKPRAAHNLFDHTSILKFLAEKFGQGRYSGEVDSRPVENISAALDFTDPILRPPVIPPVDAYLNQRPPPPATAVIPDADTELQKAFRQGIQAMKEQGAGADHPKFGELLQQVPPLQRTSANV